MTSDGGTEHNHAVTIARSESIQEPYCSNNPRNPILTHRHLGLDNPIVGTGHADFVETQTGEWWMVCLAMRPYSGYYYNLGREAFFAPMYWEDSWPIVSPRTGGSSFLTPFPTFPNILGRSPQAATILPSQPLIWAGISCAPPTPVPTAWAKKSSIFCGFLCARSTWQPVAESVDGQHSTNHADFDWFVYVGLRETHLGI